MSWEACIKGLDKSFWQKDVENLRENRRFSILSSKLGRELFLI